MFTGLSKLADRPFILGYFLPALLGILAFVIFNRDIPLLCSLLKLAIQGQKAFGDVLSVLIGIWVVAILLMTVTHWSYRLLEGYYFPVKNQYTIKLQLWRRERLKGHWRVRYQEHAAVNTAYELSKSNLPEYLKAMKKIVLDGGPVIQSKLFMLATLAISTQKNTDISDNEINAVLRQQAENAEKSARLECQQLQGVFIRTYPEDLNQILATRFGNAIRSFEMYASRVYGAEYIDIWPRLCAVIEKEYQSVISDARATVDFFVGLIVVAVIVGIITLGRGVEHLITDPSPELGTRLVATSIISLASTWAWYSLAILSVGTWGETVKSAVDIYLPVLNHKLGFEIPETAARQRDFWMQWSIRFWFHEPADFTTFKRLQSEDKAVAPQEAGGTGDDDRDGENEDVDTDADEDSG
jgi:hypothetical protein